MGLLDDAIREHLELKRRRGADPGEVAREQREALEPVPRDQRSESGGGVAVAEDVTAEAVVASDADAAPAGANDAAPVGGEPLGDDSAVATAGGTGSNDPPSAFVQETAELDMQTVLDGREDDAVAEAGAGHDEESLEWEVPGEAAVEPPADVGNKAHAPAGDVDETERGEDVLEETPNFLRDTPEQDRLWFEQRPPRDFDFDK
jgi:hypothetical protein